MMGLGALELINELALPPITFFMMSRSFGHHEVTLTYLKPAECPVMKSLFSVRALISRVFSYSFNSNMNNADPIQNCH